MTDTDKLMIMMMHAKKKAFVETLADHSEMRTYAFFSANLHKLCPGIPYEHHPTLFMEANRFSELAMDDARNIGWADSFQPPADLLGGMREPGLIASFHTGPYRLLCTWLLKMGVPITVVVSADVAQKQTENNVQVSSRVGGGKVDGYDYLIAEDPLVLRKMMAALKRGRYLVLYIDGHIGVSKDRQRRTTMAMDFLAHQLWVKTGAAELARLASVPIYPILARFDERDRPVLERFETIAPAGTGRTGPSVVHESMSRLYGHLQSVVERWPAQWEGWFYIQHDLIQLPGRGGGGIFQYYLPFKVEEKHFLLHKDSFSAFPISADMYQQLKYRIR